MNQKKLNQVKTMVSEGWTVDKILKYFTMLDDFAGIGAVLAYKRANNLVVKR